MSTFKLAFHRQELCMHRVVLPVADSILLLLASDPHVGLTDYASICPSPVGLLTVLASDPHVGLTDYASI